MLGLDLSARRRREPQIISFKDQKRWRLKFTFSGIAALQPGHHSTPAKGTFLASREIFPINENQSGLTFRHLI